MGCPEGNGDPLKGGIQGRKMIKCFGKITPSCVGGDWGQPEGVVTAETEKSPALDLK